MSAECNLPYSSSTRRASCTRQQLTCTTVCNVSRCCSWGWLRAVPRSPGVSRFCLNSSLCQLPRVWRRCLICSVREASLRPNRHHSSMMRNPSRARSKLASKIRYSTFWDCSSAIGTEFINKLGMGENPSYGISCKFQPVRQSAWMASRFGGSANLKHSVTKG